MRTATLALLAVIAGSCAATASAAMIVQESFYIADPANPAMGEYAAGLVAGGGIFQNPSTIGSMGLAWQGGAGSTSGTGVITAVAQGLTYSGASATGGSARFLHTSTLTDPRTVKRALTTGYDLDSPVYYMSGLMSFDANFSTATTATAYMSFTNTEDTFDNRSSTSSPSTIILGTQWGFQGNGAGGVDAMMRVRGHNPTDIVNVVLASDINPGTYQFVFKVEPNYAGGSPDYVTAWLNPASLASEAAAGAPVAAGVYSNWVPGGSNPSYIVDTLTLKGWNLGANAAVGFDEFRFGTSWNDLFCAPEQHIGLRQGVDGYQHLGAQLWEGRTDNQGTISTMAVGRVSTTAAIRSVLGWDLSAIPEGSTITGASLTLNSSTVSGQLSNIGTIELRSLTNAVAMIENEVTWDLIRTGTDWDTPGGDYDSSVLLGMITPAENATFVMSTDELVGAVQSALDGKGVLEMILLAPDAEALGTVNFLRFHSDDASTLALRPLLTVTYIPEPSAVMLLALAAVASLMFRRRR
ncbi:MAG: DNRLRE domain-containing protein [Thermoguttaceae bacterium]|jgi:hypothetical protein|nr:DNRLRE domain-containing protein [Thermoguttaceae bacterium]